MQEMQKILEQIVDFAKNKKSTKEFIQFVEIFYSENQARDFQSYSKQDLYNAAKLSFDFFANKKSGDFKVRIYNPHSDDGGFDSPYTLLDIVNDDKPFLVDSVVAYLDKQGIEIKNIIHPIVPIKRDENGDLVEVFKEKNGCDVESVIQLHLEKLIIEESIDLLQENIEKILNNISLVVSDWKPMVELAKKAQNQVDKAKKLGKKDLELSEIKDFISWLNDDNFIFLGAKEFDIVKNSKDEYCLEGVESETLGIFRSQYEDYRPQVMNSSVAEVADSVTNPYVVEVLKSRYRARIHRNTNAERIRIQKISDDGKVIGEFRFVGLFTSEAYNQSSHLIPFIREKIDQAIADSGFLKGSHNYKDLVSVLSSYPRDELFQISAQDLLKNALGIVAICGRSQVRFFARNDKFKRFVSCLIFMPRDRSNTLMREKIRVYLAKAYKGEIADSFVQITESNLTRIHLIIRTNKIIPDVDELAIEKEILAMTRNWVDDLRDSINARFEDEKSISLYSRYRNAFSVSYKNRFDSKRAAIDVARIESCLEQNRSIFNLYKSTDDSVESSCELKIYNPEKEIFLSEIMPILETFGFEVIQEHTYLVTSHEDEKNRSQKKVWVHYFRLNLSKNGHEFSERIRLNFEKTISKIWNNEIEYGMLNRLVITADLSWKQVYTLRAYTKYLYQAGFRYSTKYISDVLVGYRDITRLLISLFEIRFDPFFQLSNEERLQRSKEITARIRKSLESVLDVTDDMVIGKFLDLINATNRTNYYQSLDRGGFKGYMSFKFDCSKIPDLPLPLPFAEIFVYSPKVEAVHLRGGKVARGGLRWSDRHEDFRTEVLGLMKAQMTKNAVIVPVGSKGGFVVKSDISGLSRQDAQKEAIKCYKTFLSGALDITDNIIDGEVIHPDSTVIYDGIDPYFVVAADKGTATFSDIANEISAKYNFWLGDAFASGGSAGYDHKKMGITAKGAWVSVMRHFREMGIDTQSQEFSCAGIGDMAGDVFGNGMLLSKHIKLVAAFNHMHIFLDPNPDVPKSYEERQRIFNLERSTWQDYDKSLISKGGGIFERSAKSIKLSKEVKEALNIAEDELTPTELIIAILKSPVDLLWNGGIGTYAKSSSESHQEVGDRANDILRVNGKELGCKVIGEGGNLGFTQKGRIEYALKGGRVNTDSVDNSAGVDCSDHEVNIKIALTQAIKDGKLDIKERNEILESMTDEVADLVLIDNQLQTQAISTTRYLGSSAIGDQSQFLDKLERVGLLNREIEFLPSKKEIDKRRSEKIGLTRPELSVMLSYAKMDIYAKLLKSDILDDEYFDKDLFDYFPKLMQEKFVEEISNHRLKREIIATQITNFIVNRMGITFVSQLSQNTGFDNIEVIKCIIIAADSFRLRDVWREIESLDGKVSAEIQSQMFLNASKLVERTTVWLLRNHIKGNIAPVVENYQKIVDKLSDSLSIVLAKASKESFERKIERYCLNGVERKLATKIASMDPVAAAFDIAEISANSDFDIDVISKIYYAVGTRFSLKWLRSRLTSLTFKNHWQKISSKTILEDLYGYQAKIATLVIEYACKDKNVCESDSIESWIKTVDFLVERYDLFISDIKSHPNPDLSVFMVAINRLKPLV